LEKQQKDVEERRQEEASKRIVEEHRRLRMFLTFVLDVFS